MALIHAPAAAIDPGTILSVQQFHPIFCRERQRAANHINQLESRENIGMESRIPMPGQNPQCRGRYDGPVNTLTLSDIRNSPTTKRIRSFARGNTKDFFRLVAEEVGEFFLKHQCDPR